MRISIAGHIHGRDSHAAAHGSHSFIYQIHPQFLVAKVGSFLEHQLFILEKNVVYYQDDLTHGLIFSFDAKIVFPVSVFREYPYVSYSYGDIRLQERDPPE
jgi:hypothetical protein